MPETELYARVPEVVEANVGGKSFLLHVNEWVYLELNESGSRIWTLLDGARRLDDLTESLVETFAVEPEVCAAETAEFLLLLEEKHFVRRSRAA